MVSQLEIEMYLSLQFYFLTHLSMRNIGIDVAKLTLAVFMPQGDSFAVNNDKDGFCEILSKLKPRDVIGVESTGNYHHELAKFFLKKGVRIRELNPILTKQFIRATIRGRKTDKTDAEIISRLLENGEGHCMTLENIDNKLKKLFRVRTKLVQKRASIKLQLQVLKPDIKIIARSYKKLIKSFDTEIQKLEEEMNKFENEETEILESIPGISTKLARGILAEIGDIGRFNDKRKLVAFAGYDPKLTESGTSMHRTGKLTKRGSPYLRHALYLAAFANIRSKNIFADYYNKKKSEGKHHFKAITATSRKVLEIIYALLQKGEKFRLDFS